MPVVGVRAILVMGVILAAVLLAGIAAGSGSGLQFSKNRNTVTITGYTNLATGDRLLLEVVSAGFTPAEKGSGAGFSGAAGTVVVQPGSPLNTYRFDVDVSSFHPGLYLVTVESVETGFMDSGQFVLPWTPAPTEVPSQPAAVTSPVTTPAPVVTAAPAPRGSPTPAPLPTTLPLCAVIPAAVLLGRHRGGRGGRRVKLDSLQSPATRRGSHVKTRRDGR
jgi:hypothetical protein